MGLAGSRSHDRTRKFFSRGTWSSDTPGMYLSRLIVRTALPDAASITVAVDDSLFNKRGKKCSAPRGSTMARRGKDGIGFGFASW